MEASSDSVITLWGAAQNSKSRRAVTSAKNQESKAESDIQSSYECSKKTNMSVYICKPQTYSACDNLIRPELMLHARHLQKGLLN